MLREKCRGERDGESGSLRLTGDKKQLFSSQPTFCWDAEEATTTGEQSSADQPTGTSVGTAARGLARCTDTHKRAGSPRRRYVTPQKSFFRVEVLKARNSQRVERAAATSSFAEPHAADEKGGSY